MTIVIRSICKSIAIDWGQRMSRRDTNPLYSSVGRARDCNCSLEPGPNTGWASLGHAFDSHWRDVFLPSIPHFFRLILHGSTQDSLISSALHLVERIRAFRDTPGTTFLLPRFVYISRDFASGAFRCLSIRFSTILNQLDTPITPQKSTPTMSQQENLFKPIGQLAQDTDARPEVDDDDARLQEGGEFQEGNEREVEQVESLCMECHQQVGWLGPGRNS